MQLVEPSYEIIQRPQPLSFLEECGRTCYKSEDKITPDSAFEFIRMIIAKGHESVLEHTVMTVRFIVNRGVTHELVRHRIASFSQESTRYCNYKGGVTFIIPPQVEFEPGEYETLRIPHLRGNDGCWAIAMWNAERRYQNLLDGGWTAQQARDVLPNATKAEIVTTANLREWRLIFKQRCSPQAHPQMYEVMRPLLAQVKEQVPVIFEDLEV